MNKAINPVWLPCWNKMKSPRLRVFAFPFGGGSASAFKTWSENMPTDVEFYSLQLPGRESRTHEPLFDSIPKIVGALTVLFKSAGTDVPFVFYGHSMGSLVAYELTRALQKLKIAPVELMVSGYPGPQKPRRHPQKHELPEAQFIEELVRYGGTSPEVFASPELTNLYLPILRADFKAVETYEYKDAGKLNVPVVGFCGDQDATVTRDEMQTWADLTSAPFDLQMIKGGHFFIKESYSEFMAAFSQQLSRVLGQLKKTA